MFKMATESDETNDPRPSLSKVLLDYVNNTVIHRSQALEYQHQRILERVVNPIITRIGDFDDRFHAQNLDAAGCYVALQHVKQHEFDCVVRLPHLTDSKTLDHDGDETTTRNSIFLDSSLCDNPYVDKLPGFGFLVVDRNKTLVHNLTTDRTDNVHGERLTENEGYLCPKKVTSVFDKCIRRAVQELENERWWEEEPSVFEVKVFRQGPSVTLTAYLTGEVFTVHLLPGVPFDSDWPETLRRWGPPAAVRPNLWLKSSLMKAVMEDYVVFPGQTPEGGDPRLWAMCFYCSEKRLCRAAEENSRTIHREARLAMEALCTENEDAFHPMTPRLLRMIFLRQCMKFPHEGDWSPKRLGRAFVDIFSEVVSSAKSGSCPHFFVPRLDMLGHLSKSDLRPVSRHLTAILNDIVENPGKTKFLPQRKKKKRTL